MERSSFLQRVRNVGIAAVAMLGLSNLKRRAAFGVGRGMAALVRPSEKRQHVSRYRLARPVGKHPKGQERYGYPGDKLRRRFKRTALHSHMWT
jgi:hypothetical protein